MDGYQATQEIRKNPHFKNPPIVALTAKAMQEDRQKCADSGCSDFVPKPVENEKLLHVVEKWVDSSRKTE
jgi:CheY-like chemotaxis protein